MKELTGYGVTEIGGKWIVLTINGREMCACEAEQDAITIAAALNDADIAQDI